MTVTVLCDAVAPFPDPVSVALPAWDERHLRWTRRTMPGNMHGGEWLLHVHSYLILDGPHVVLVDTGIGDHHRPGGRWLGTGGRLPDLLTDAGVAPEDVTDVVLTHVHLDHVGWNTTDMGQPRFPNASYLVQAAERAHARRGATYRELVSPVERAGQLRILDGETRLSRDIRLLPTPGHTPGHQSVASGNMLLTGDLFVHPAQVAFPDLTYREDDDPRTATTSRRTVIRRAGRDGSALCGAHAQGALRVARDGTVTAHPLRCG